MKQMIWRGVKVMTPISAWLYFMWTYSEWWFLIYVVGGIIFIAYALSTAENYPEDNTDAVDAIHNFQDNEQRSIYE